MDKEQHKIKEINARCYGCARALEPEFGSKDSLEDVKLANVNRQWDNAMIVSFSGGYGMFIDHMGEELGGNLQRGVLGEFRVVICHECSHDLCDQVPWVFKLIDPFYSHSHRPESTHPDHPGWDHPRN